MSAISGLRTAAAHAEMTATTAATSASWPERLFIRSSAATSTEDIKSHARSARLENRGEVSLASVGALFRKRNRARTPKNGDMAGQFRRRACLGAPARDPRHILVRDPTILHRLAVKASSHLNGSPCVIYPAQWCAETPSP